MHNLLSHLIASGFAELKGLDITFRIPIPQTVLNDVLTELLRPNGPQRAAAPPNPSTTALPRLDASAVLGLLKSAEILAEAGTIIVQGHLQR